MKSSVDRVQIRAAKDGDAPGIAAVHVKAWQEAYAGLLPQEYLDKLPMDQKRRESWWHQVIQDPKNHVLHVVEAESGIAGFAAFNAGRDKGQEHLAEVSAIYLLEKYKGKGIGFALLSSGFRQMIPRGFRKGYCWVLEHNPTIHFYERSGASFTGRTKEAEIAGRKFNELAYHWPTLRIESPRVAESP